MLSNSHKAIQHVTLWKDSDERTYSTYINMVSFFNITLSVGKSRLGCLV